MIQQIQLETLDMDQVKVDPRWALRIPGNLAVRRKLLPFTLEGEHVLVACVNPNDCQGLQAVERYVEAPVIPNLADEASLERAIHRIFQEPVHACVTGGSPVRVKLDASGLDSEMPGDDIVALGDEIFNAALIRGATDIHVEPAQHDVGIRFRVDGILQESSRPARQSIESLHGPM